MCIYEQTSHFRVGTFLAAVSEIHIIKHDANYKNNLEHKLNPLPPVILWDENPITKYMVKHNETRDTRIYQ